MPFWVRAALPAVAAAIGFVLLAGLYATSSAPEGATLVNRLTAGESWRWFAAFGGVLALLWGGSGLLAQGFKRAR